MIKQVTVLSCDRCGKSWEYNGADRNGAGSVYKEQMICVRDYGAPNKETYDDYTEYDLCQACYKDFQNFLHHKAK